MHDQPNPVPRLRHEKVARLIELINARELATSEAEYEAATQLIKAMEALIKCPVPSTFLARIEASRQPWVRIMERALTDMRSGAFKYPFSIERFDGENVLFTRMKFILSHADQLACLPLFWQDIPSGRDRELKRQLTGAGVFVMDQSGMVRVFERPLAGRRTAHLVAVRLAALKTHGIES